MTQIAFISLIEPKNINEACADDFWTIAMQEELNQFVRNDVWDLVQHPTEHPVIGTRWSLRTNLMNQVKLLRTK